MDLGVNSGVKATETILGLMDHETIESGAGFFEQGELACASGGQA